MHEHARGRTAGLTLPVHVHALDRGRCGFLRIGIGKNDDRILATKLEAHALEAGCSLARNRASRRHRAYEADALHVRMAHQRRAGRTAAGEDVDSPLWENAFAQLAKPQARQRRLLGALDHDAVARRKRSRGLLSAEAEGMIERVDLGDDAVGLAARQIDVARSLRRSLALDLAAAATEAA